MPKAKASPHQPWPHAGQACVTPENTDNLFRLPVEARNQGDHTITRADYPNGLIIVRRDFRGSTPTEIVNWDLKESAGQQETTGPGWADGIIVLFK